MIAAQKKLLRASMKKKRSLLFQENPDAGETLADLFFENIPLSSHTIVGGYWPIGSELDVRPLLRKLAAREVMCALPRITSEGLEFHLWTDTMDLVRGVFGINEPPPSTLTVTPHIVLVPLLAFDKRGHRLGYGQGHFDRYLHQHPALTIGIGFRDQEIEQIPYQPHDFALDYILTEREMIKSEP